MFKLLSLLAAGLRVQAAVISISQPPPVFSISSNLPLANAEALKAYQELTHKYNDALDGYMAVEAKYNEVLDTYSSALSIYNDALSRFVIGSPEIRSLTSSVSQYTRNIWDFSLDQH